MYSYTSATLAMRAKCSYYDLCLPNDQPHCFRRPCCHFPCNDLFPVSPRILSGYLFGQHFTVPSAAIILAGRLRVRVFSRSIDSELMDLLAEPERFCGSEDLGRKSRRRREVEIKSVVGRCRGSIKEEKEGSCLSRNGGSNSVTFSSSTLLRESELNGTGRRRRLAGESLIGCSASKNGTKFDAADAAEEEVQEVHKYVDDSWRRRRRSLKTDFVLDSTKDDHVKKNDTLRRLGADGEHESTDQRTNLAQRMNSWENISNGRSHKFTRISEVQSGNVRSPASANVRRTEKEESSASAAWQNSDVDHGMFKHAEHGISKGKQSKLADFNYASFHDAAYPSRDLHRSSIRGKEEQTSFKQKSSQVACDKRLQLDHRAAEQEGSARSSQRLSEVSVFHGSDFGKASCIDDRRFLGVDAKTNLVPDSGQIFPEKMTQMALKRHVESKSNERAEKLAMEGNSIYLRIDDEKQIDRRALEHEEARRSTEARGEVPEIRSSILEASSLFNGSRITGLDSRSDVIQISIPATKDKAIQVEMNEAHNDQIEDSRFNTTSSWRHSDSRVDPQEYNALVDLSQVSSLQEQYNRASKQTYSQENTYDATRSNNRMVTSLQEYYNSRLENKEETFSDKNLIELTREEEMQRSSLTRKSSKSASMQITAVESLHGVSMSQPTYSEVHDHAGGSDILKNQRYTNDSARKSYKLSASHVGESVNLLQKEVVDVNKSRKTPHDSSGVRIEPGRKGVQTTLIADNRKEIFSRELNTERKERTSSLFLGESSQSKPMPMASASLGGIPSSLKTGCELVYDGGHITDNAFESAKQFDKYSGFHVEEFVDKMQQEITLQSKIGTAPNASLRVQTEEIVNGGNQATAAMGVGELNEGRKDGDTRFINESGKPSPSELGKKGPSDEMWDAEGLSSQRSSKTKEPEVEFPTSEVIVSTTPTPLMETHVTRRSPKSLWSYVTDIIRMSWILRRHSHSSTLQSVTRASSNESITSDTFFSGHEPDEFWSGDESRNEEKISLLKELAPVKESDELFFEKSKNKDKLDVKEPNLSISLGIMKNGLSTKTASSSVDAVQLVSKTDAALPSTTGIVESSVSDKVKVLKPSSSYPLAMLKIGFSSSITQPTDAAKTEAAQVREGNNSGLEIFDQTSISNVDSVLSGIIDTEDVRLSGNDPPKVELDSFRGKLPEISGIKESGMKQRKFKRNKQVLREQFDEWEETFKLESEQKKVDEIFMKEAILEARKGADTWEVPVGAVLVQNGRIIARSCNLVEELRDSTAHAEMICIRQASNLLRTWRLAETTLYVTLEPCPMCAGAILQARVDTVVWGAPNRLLGADGSWVRLFPGGDGGSNSMDPPGQMVGPVHPFHPKIKVRRGVLETECGDVMQQFFKLRRKKDTKQEPTAAPPSCLPLSNRPTKLFTKLHNIFCMMFCL